MTTVKDALKIKENDSLFIDKPLRKVLNEIVPEIKLVFAESNRAHNALSYFIFKFVSREEYNKYIAANKRPVTILVYVKENFDWNKSKENMLQWTKEDAETYGNLTVYRIGVLGETL
jgi:hypothetical protein